LSRGDSRQGTPAPLQGTSSPSGFAPFPEPGKQPALARQRLHPTAFLVLFPLLLLNITEMPAIVPRLGRASWGGTSPTQREAAATISQLPAGVRRGSEVAGLYPTPRASPQTQPGRGDTSPRNDGHWAANLHPAPAGTHLKPSWDSKVYQDKGLEPQHSPFPFSLVLSSPALYRVAPAAGSGRWDQVT